jgi:hypothetical protein
MNAEVPLETLFEALLIALSEAVTAEHGPPPKKPPMTGGPKRLPE